MCLIFMKFGTQDKSNMLITNILIVIDDIDKKLQICENLVPRLKCASIFIKFGTWSKLNMLIMNIVLGIDDLDQN